MLDMLKNAILQEFSNFGFFGNQQGWLLAFANLLLSYEMTTRVGSSISVD